MRNHMRGDSHYRAKLTEADVKLIREMVAERRELRRQADSMSDRVLAEKFGVSRSCINRVAQYEVWAHV